MRGRELKPNLKWEQVEREFDDKFIYLQDCLNTYFDDYFGQIKGGQEMTKIKTFIRSTLKRFAGDIIGLDRKTVGLYKRDLGEVEIAVQKRETEAKDDGYNQAIQEAHQRLKEMLK